MLLILLITNVFFISDEINFIVDANIDANMRLQITKKKLQVALSQN